ncbi:hypothetical protein D9757_014602 [Collybiopsis confluens]|uniref:Uncharacterized protein n=1 Tax=Collybiopsis confluens TaxID=2823264 RepID=A0A8H5FL87_9AGAR|nr:hypothetical protein D9757_014602 [Collybiopsis confluens]
MEKQENENKSQSRPQSPTEQTSNENLSQGSPQASRPSSQAPSNKSRPASQASNRPPSQAASNKSRPASQASDRPPSQAASNKSRPASQASNRPPSQASNRPQSQASNKSNKPQSRNTSASPSVSRPPPSRSPRGRSRTPRSISAASAEDENEPIEADDRAPTPTAEHPGEQGESGLPNVNEEEGEGDNAIEKAAEADDKGNTKEGEKKSGKRRRRGKKNAKSFGVDAWPHGDEPGPMEPLHGVDDWPYGDDDEEGVGASGRVLRRPKGVRDFSPAYEPSEAGSGVSSAAGTDYSSVSGLSLGDWDRTSLPAVDTWPYGDNPGIMIKPLDHWGNPLKNPDGTLMQKENPTGLPNYEELQGMDLDTHDDHVIALKLEIDIDIAVEINARIHGDLTLALL